jgi:cytochrome c
LRAPQKNPIRIANRKTKRPPSRIHAYLPIAGLLLGAAGWLQAQSRPPEMRAQDTKAMVDRGEDIFKGRCEICHFAASSEKKVGPGLRGLMKGGKRGTPQRWDTAAVTRVIQNGGKDMPGFRAEINEAQLRDLLAYLRTL